MPRKAQGWVTFQTSEEEKKILEEFCQNSQRTKTEILRELVRSLNNHSVPLIPALAPDESQRKVADEIRQRETTNPKKLLKVSSRNVLKGVVSKVVTGVVNTEVTLEIVHQVELISIITRVSAEELELFVGQEAYAVIKSHDVAIARD
jgi:molybdopterin-binding protein